MLRIIIIVLCNIFLRHALYISAFFRPFSRIRAGTWASPLSAFPPGAASPFGTRKKRRRRRIKLQIQRKRGRRRERRNTRARARQKRCAAQKPRPPSGRRNGDSQLETRPRPRQSGTLNSWCWAAPTARWCGCSTWPGTSRRASTRRRVPWLRGPWKGLVLGRRASGSMCTWPGWIWRMRSAVRIHCKRWERLRKLGDTLLINSCDYSVRHFWKIRPVFRKLFVHAWSCVSLPYS